MTRTKWLVALLGGVLSTPFMSPLSGVSASTKAVLPLGHVVQSSPAFRPSAPVPTTVEVSLPQAKKATVVFEFHPSTHPTSVRLVGQNRAATAQVCASDGVDNTGSWSKYWSGCINIPTRGALLPADDGLSHVGVAVHVTSPGARLKGSSLGYQIPTRRLHLLRGRTVAEALCRSDCHDDCKSGALRDRG